MDKISIIIPTFNRAKSLRRTLASLQGLAPPGNCRIEVLVVDNNSSDDTPRVVEQLASSVWFDLRYARETIQGTNQARNRGIAEASGDLLVFTEDDVEFSPTWLDAFVEGYQQYPNVSSFTGKIIPRFEQGRPEWLPDSMLSYFALQDYGDTSMPLQLPNFPFEGNMALPRTVLQKFGGFSVEISRTGKTLMSNDGKLFFHRLGVDGGEVMYLPGALLYHLIPPERTTESWLMRRAYWQGVSDIAFEQLIHPRSRVGNVSLALSVLSRMIRKMTGGNWSPRKAYWHYCALTPSTRASIRYDAGQFYKLTSLGLG